MKCIFYESDIQVTYKRELSNGTRSLRGFKIRKEKKEENANNRKTIFYYEKDWRGCRF